MALNNVLQIGLNYILLLEVVLKGVRRLSQTGLTGHSKQHHINFEFRLTLNTLNLAFNAKKMQKPGFLTLGHN